MCQYCGEKSKTEREALIRDAEHFVKQLEDLGAYYLRAARGYAIDHSGTGDERAVMAGRRARLVVRRLVGDWV